MARLPATGVRLSGRFHTTYGPWPAIFAGFIVFILLAYGGDPTNAQPPVKIEVVELEVEPADDTAELHCLASTLFGEAGTEPELGKVLVAITVMNRVALDRYPDSICGVVSQPRQFTGYRSSRSASIYASKAWEESLRVSREVMGGAWRLGTCGTATHFDGVNSRARWIRSPRMIQLCRVNNHVFYLETTQ